MKPDLSIDRMLDEQYSASTRNISNIESFPVGSIFISAFNNRRDHFKLFVSVKAMRRMCRNDDFFAQPKLILFVTYLDLRRAINYLNERIEWRCFSGNSSPAPTAIAVMLPVVFLIMVLIKTDLGIYSSISTIMCGIDFSSSVLSS